MWFVYILKCKDKTLYTGVTKDLAKRLEKHNKGTASKYTRCRVPVKMVFTETHSDKISAMKREYQIKQLTKIKKLALIKGNKKKDK
ncbi:MAG: GIY-YIG nuclease family protein [Candidatus Omnitrophica bacterium]|nr:GIY-YIG nuclease family protein [Candidatus Omnitrophota bacterium]